MTQQPRIFVWAALLIMLYLNYTAWNADYGVRPDTQTTSSPAPGAPAVAAPDLSNQVPQAPKPSADVNASPSAAEGTQEGAVPAVQAGAPAPSDTTGLVHVRTDVLDLGISLRGGTVVSADLLRYPKVKGEAAPVRL